MKNIIRGYHGTTLESANQILAQGFEQSESPWDWLGRGIYFWQDAPWRAYRWGLEWSRRRGRQGQIVVVQANIEMVNCLDLLDIFWDEPVKEASRQFLERLQSSGADEQLHNKPGGRNFLDCAFFNSLADKLGDDGFNVKSIRAAVTEGTPLFQGSPIHDRSHVQVAVRDPTAIGFVRITPLEEDLLNVTRGFEEL